MACSTGILYHARKPVPDDVEPTLVDRYFALQPRFDVPDFVRIGSLDPFNHVRIPERAVIRDSGVGHGELQRRDQVKSLPDGNGDGLTALPRNAGRLLLPPGGGNQSGMLALNAYSSSFAQSEHVRVLGKPVHAQLHPELVKVDVAALHQCTLNVHSAVPRVSPAAVLAIAELEVTGTVERRGRGDGAFLEPCKGHEGLVRGTGRIRGAACPVEKRVIGVLAERVPLLTLEPSHKFFLVETRAARERKHRAVGRVHGHDRAGLAFQKRLGLLLKIHIEGEPQVSARYGKDLIKQAYPPADGVHLYLPPPPLAVKILFEGPLNPHLTDVFTGVIPLIFITFHLSFGNFAEIADEVRGRSIPFVFPFGFKLNEDAGQPDLLGLYAPEAIPVEIAGDPNGNELGRGAVRLDNGEKIIRVTLAKTRQFPDRRVQIADVFTDDHQMVGRTVLDDRHSIAVKNDAAGSGDLFDPNPVILGLKPVRRSLKHLELPQPGDVDHDEDQHHADKQYVRLLERNGFRTFPVDNLYSD